MVAERFLSLRSLAGSFLILGVLLTFLGVILWTGRNMWNWPAAGAAGYIIWERGLIIAGIVGALLGFVLLEEILKAAGDSAAARLGLVLLLVGAVLGIAGEAEQISKKEWTYALIVVYVVLAFLGQAAFGVSLLRTELLAGWIGWVTIVWNLGWLAALPFLSPGDIYYPVLHFAAPLLIGIALLATR